MTTNKKKGMTLEGKALEREVFRAMRSEGWLIPTTVEEVLEAQKSLAEAGIDINSLAEKPHDRPVASGKVISICPANGIASGNEIRENLARAAREGGEISSEVEERMRRDRDAAEANKGD
jgi:hypothetical protein